MHLSRLSALFAGMLVFAAGHALGVEMPSREALPKAAAPAAFRAPALPTYQSVSLDAPLEKSAAAIEEHPGGRLKVGSVRALPKSAAVEQWRALDGGFVTRLDAASAGAEGLRVRLDLGGLADAIEVRVQGMDGRIETMPVHPGQREAWTPWTEGSAQVIELFSAVPQPIAVGAVLHFTTSPYAKAAGTCTVPTLCTTNDAALDAAVLQRKKSVMRINFVSGGSGFVCSATLINTDKFPSAYVLTANHCIDTVEAANSVTSLWFYEQSTCDTASAVAPGQVQVAGGMQLVFTNHNVDSSLLLMSQAPPSGSVYAGFNAARMTTGTPVTSISHPAGDTARLALGSVNGELRIIGRPHDMYGIRFTRGIIQGGSSGSAVFTLAGTSLQVRGVLSGTTIRNAGGMSCTNTDEEALYGRLDLFYPQIEQYIRNVSVAADDAPNRIQDFTDSSANDTPLDTRTTPLAFDGRRLNYAGDVDLYRFTLSAPAVVSAWTEGPNLDTVGSILSASGKNLEANDDEQVADNHFGITRKLDPGVYYVHVAHFEPLGTGAYNLRIRADSVETRNHTSLWWKSDEPGWGLNVNHQGNKIFATLFTYDTTGPVWLVMSDGNRQPDGTYLGPLYRASGPAFNASPFTGVSVAEVGTMRLSFAGSNGANVAYTFNGAQVSKGLTRQEFGTVPECSWSAFDRSFVLNYQDLWYNPAEPGWGVNIAHQGNTLFATLFTYDATGRGIWLVMSAGTLNGAGAYSGPLYRTTGPAFNATPWVPATATQVGTMTFTPSHGNSATLTYTFNGVTVTKQVQRQTFGNLKPACK